MLTLAVPSSGYTYSLEPFLDPSETLGARYLTGSADKDDFGIENVSILLLLEKISSGICSTGTSLEAAQFLNVSATCSALLLAVNPGRARCKVEAGSTARATTNTSSCGLNSIGSSSRCDCQLG